MAAKAGVTKRTLYYHFKSKDDLVAAYLAGRDQPNLALFKQWFAEADGGLPAKVERIFRNLARSARHPKWKGCGFLRTSAELANMPGHPAMKIGAAHKKKFEDWLRATFEAEGIAEASQLARQILLLLDGSFAVVLLHRDPSYMETAGQAAHALTKAALPGRKARAVADYLERLPSFRVPDAVQRSSRCTAEPATHALRGWMDLGSAAHRCALRSIRGTQLFRASQYDRAFAAPQAPRRDHPPPPRIARATRPSAAPCPAP